MIIVDDFILREGYFGPPDWGLCEGLTTPHHKNQLVTKCYIGPQNWRALLNTVMNLRVT